jgi:hypothetical protein
MFFNLYADHFLDRAFLRRVRDGRLLRYADDLLIMCRTPAEGARAADTLGKVAAGAGLSLKAGLVLLNMAEGKALDWLGYRVQFSKGEPVVKIADRAWQTLDSDLESAYGKPVPTLYASDRVDAWFDYLGPAFPNEDRDAVITRVLKIGKAHRFDELPSSLRLMERWQHAFNAWLRVRKDVDEELPTRLEELERWNRDSAVTWK